MKKVILDFNDISDSKEVYGQRPNPFVRAVLYLIIIMVAAALAYAYFGEIEVYARCEGTVRPNEDVSTVSSMVSGRIESVEFSDGDTVDKGDILLKIETTDEQITLDSLSDEKKICERKIALEKALLKGIRNGKNPFSSSIDSDEYPYYIRYRDFALELKSTAETLSYDEKKTEAQLKALHTQAEAKKTEAKGLEAYRKSVESGENLLSAYPQYESAFLAYEAEKDKLRKEYESEKSQIESGTDEESSKHFISYYNEQMRLYQTLIRCIRSESADFPYNDSLGTALYTEYQNELAEYERSYESAKKTYEYYLSMENEGEEGQTADAELAYSIAEAKIKLESAEASIQSLKDKTISEYEAVLDELSEKLRQAEISQGGTRSKSVLLKELADTYEQTEKLQYYNLLSQIDSSADSTAAELRQLQADIELNQIAKELYENSLDENGEKVSISSATVKEINQILETIQALGEQKKELEYQIKTTKEQLQQGAIKAEQAGIFNMPQRMVRGDVLTAGESIGTVIPQSESKYRVRLYVSNADIANIKVGSSIKYNIAALPSSQYGIAEGSVISVSQDVLTDGGVYSGYYVVEGSIGKEELTDRSGNSASVEVGMQVEAKIVTEKKRIFRYLLEKIDLF